MTVERLDFLNNPPGYSVSAGGDFQLDGWGWHTEVGDLDKARCCLRAAAGGAT